MANLGNMLGGISHTLNNILGGVLGYAQLLKSSLPEESDLVQQAVVIETAARRASKLISRLSLYSNNKCSYQLIPIDPRKLVEETVAILGCFFPSNIQLSTEFNHGATNILADFPSLCHVLLNICMNAKEAMPRGGTLKISTDCICNVELTHVFETPQNAILIQITDTGSGIQDEFLPHIFEPFFSTKPTGSANGFGLTVAKEIIDELQGVIKVNSAIGQGTTVSIYLPLNSNPLQEKPPLNKQKDASTEGQMILVVDDEEDLRGIAKEILQRKGFRVLLAENGDQAIEVYERHFRQIQIVLLDLILPGLAGDEVYRRIKQINPDQKIILTSGYTKHSQELQPVQGFALDYYLPKPWEIPALIEIVNRLLEED